MVLARRATVFAERDELLAERVHLSHVAAIQPEMLRDLGVRDAVQALQMIEDLPGVECSLRSHHGNLLSLTPAPVACRRSSPRYR
jgi:hypothetical protein